MNNKKIVGKKFGRLIVTRFHHKEHRLKNGRKAGYKYFYICKCDCGKEKIVSYENLTNGHTSSCGCARQFKNTKNLTGLKFGRLEVLSLQGKDKKGNVLWLCKCDCGNIKIIKSALLLSGTTKSCGCYRRDCGNIQDFSTKHNKSYSKIYRSWSCMKSRCYNKKDTNHYSSYGGRGIAVCDEWKNDFVKFYDWAMANGYKEGLTIDRIDVNGNYEPNNCRWATAKEQANNRRKTIYISYKGETHTIPEWSDILKIKRYVLRYRIKKYGITEKTFFQGKLPFSWKGRNKGVEYII